VLLLALAACDDCGRTQPPAPRAASQPAPQPAQTSAKAAVPPAPSAPPEDAQPITCAELPIGLIRETLEISELQPSSERIDGKATLCEYNTNPEGKFASVRVERGYDPSRFESSKTAFPNATDISGYGDRAFMSTLPMMGPKTPHGIHGIAVLKGHTHLTISAPVPPERVQLLARGLLEHL
jgi:hypothetical protein